jgi:tRNA(Ile)-lysidine synthase
MPPEAAVLAALGAPLPRRLGVAVSGGGDSMALLHILAGIYQQTGGILEAVTVDHGLRDGSDREAAAVSVICAGFGVPHLTLRWQDWDGHGNLQDAARRARYGLMATWARAQALDAVALGHTADDQAETVLMRLARRSGVDGLAAMSARRSHAGTLWLRPMLGISRAALRSYLSDRGTVWIEDPGNSDIRYDRIKARRALDTLADLGIDPAGLGIVARNMAEARDALDTATVCAARECGRAVHGAVVFQRGPLLSLPVEIQRRLWCRALDWIAPAPYPPRRAGLAQLMAAVDAGRGTTLGGTAILCRDAEIWMFREYDRVAVQTVSPQAVWDGRWRLRSAQAQAAPAGSTLGALGANGLKKCGNWRDLGLPRGVLLGHPALWHGDTLLGSPVAKPHADWVFELLQEGNRVSPFAL